MTDERAMSLAIRALIDAGSLSPAARDMRPADALRQWAECNAMTPETFMCECGDVEHPAVPDDDDSTWCECGLRLDAQRARLGLDRFASELGAGLLGGAW
ncbi:hypothetical protein Cch01nite_31860 [Cellulomonas chitinilytica]|uniref:Uncharacterized protein n=2 Tax=Cellulomonas chitinilytica TaxID=398759 RepID=A0A919U3I0_9CELL|nr:hypothetical protein Cch01nite_31860 [Cellulomonas chitinilytica]